MKFLCIECDAPMALKETRGPEEGSMAVIFGCPSCGRDIAMLTNAMETQMVRTLGVKIGGRTTPARPMEMVRSSLAHGDDAMPVREEPEEAVTETPPASSGSKCPFTGMVTEAYAQQAASDPQWTSEAKARMARIPSYAQVMVRRGIEQYAREKGYTEINDIVVDEVRSRFGM